jgi:hypothetical protein
MCQWLPEIIAGRHNRGLSEADAILIPGRSALLLHVAGG